MSELNLKDQLKKLIELQKIDSEIYGLKSELEEKPVIIAGHQKEFEDSKAHLKELEEELTRVQLSRKEQELELKTKEEEISKGNTQLSQLKTNKEYTAKISEIESGNADKSVIEEKILGSYDEADGVRARIDKEKTVVAEKENEFLSKKKELENDMKQIKDRMQVLDGQRKQIIPGVDSTQLSRYEKVLAHQEGLAIAAVHGNSCGGCFMNVTTQMINQIKMYKEIVICEICSRILYIEDDL